MLICVFQIKSPHFIIYWYHCVRVKIHHAEIRIFLDIGKVISCQPADYPTHSNWLFVDNVSDNLVKKGVSMAINASSDDSLIFIEKCMVPSSILSQTILHIWYMRHYNGRAIDFLKLSQLILHPFKHVSGVLVD